MPAVPLPPRSTAPRFVRALGGHGARVALRGQDGRTWTYRELAAAVSGERDRLSGQDVRQLVLLGGSNTIGSITTYLAALAAGHVVLLVPGDHPAAVGALVEAYDPDVVVTPPLDAAGPAVIERRRPGSRHDLHPDLALLLSTSGSSGSPKLVRLSSANLDANAESIVEALGIRADDRVPTNLPMHYSYGLSVIHSHLLAGASISVTDLSVVDRCFWDRFREEGCTTLNGVPYTFDCLDRIGFADLDLPDLRSVTQAGGRLEPGRVRAYADLGRSRGWSFTVMYGQTEAAPRIATLPPELAADHPDAIGRAIPGGTLRIEPVPGAPAGTGELVYQGPNVMLGYATEPDDLARGRDVHELRTGDLGRELPGGLFEVTGRLTAFAKIAGVRIDLEHVERRLRDAGYPAWCAAADERLVVAVEEGHDRSHATTTAAAIAGIPARRVKVLPVEAVPRLPSGKPDRAAIARLATAGAGAGAAAMPKANVIGAAASAAGPAVTPPADPAAAIRELYAASLERPVRDDDSFTSLGGDSLSYVQVSLGLEEILGRLPTAWPTMSVEALAALVQPAAAPRFGRLPMALAMRWMETSVLLRALAILCIVGQHTGFVEILGGAHVLFAVAGFNFARFQLTNASRLERLRSQVRALARIAIPALGWVALMLVLADDYGLPNLVLGNAILGPERFDGTWHFWFIEMLVYTLVVVGAVLAIPAVDRLERRWPFVLAAGVLAYALLLRFHVIELGLTNPRPVLWLFAIGWAAGKATSWPQRFGVGLVAFLAVPGFYGDGPREAVITAGLLALILLPRLPVPRLLGPVMGILASASLYIYLVHWQVWTNLPDAPAPLVFALCIGAGLVAWLVAGWAAGAAARVAATLMPARTRGPVARDRRSSTPEALAPSS